MARPADPARELLDRADQLRRTIQQSVITVSSPDRSVTVTLAAGNVLTALKIAQSATRRQDGAGLAAMILQTIREAAQQLNELVGGRVRELLPASVDGSEMLATVAGDLPDPASIEDELPDPEEAAEEVPEPDLPPEWAQRPGASELAAARAAWQEFSDRSERMTAGYRAVRDRFAEAEATGSAPGISVTLRAGEVVAIEISDDALREGSDRLAAALRAALQQAHAALALRLAAQAQAFTGPALDVQRMVREHQPQQPSGEEGRR